MPSNVSTISVAPFAAADGFASIRDGRLGPARTAGLRAVDAAPRADDVVAGRELCAGTRAAVVDGPARSATVAREEAAVAPPRELDAGGASFTVDAEGVIRGLDAEGASRDVDGWGASREVGRGGGRRIMDVAGRAARARDPAGAAVFAAPSRLVVAKRLVGTAGVDLVAEGARVEAAEGAGRESGRRVRGGMVGGVGGGEGVREK